MKKTIPFYITFSALIITTLFASVSFAQPYGTGKYDENVPYGNETALSIATDGDISIPITPTSDGVLETGTSVVTVTSTDVTGYKLYIRALSDTNMNNLGALLPASSNTVPGALANNTWGYNVNDPSNNFVGITLEDVEIRSLAGPAASGENTNVKFGIKVDMAKPAGDYTANIVYTAVPQTN